MGCRSSAADRDRSGTLAICNAALGLNAGAWTLAVETGRGSARGGKRPSPLLFRQWDELLLVIRHEGKALGPPIGLGLLDALLGGGDEIPPDVARSIHRMTAQQHEATLCQRQDRDTISRLENQQLPFGKRASANIDAAGSNVNCPFVIIGIERQYRAGCQYRFGKQGFVWKLDRRPRPIGGTHYQPQHLALTRDPGKVRCAVMREGRGGFFMAFWQCRPRLDTEQAFGLCCRRLALAVSQAMPAGNEIGFARLALGMHDAAARAHQIDLARSDGQR